MPACLSSGSAFTLVAAPLSPSIPLPQDLAARGVSLVYARGGSALQATLLTQLVGVLQGAPGAAPPPRAAGPAGVPLSSDSRLFEEGALGKAPGGGGLATYQELCSLANDMGQPELIYR